MTNTNTPIRITEAELVTLLLLAPSDSTTRTAHVLGLEPQLSVGEVDRAGMQTLLVRDLATLEDELLTAQGPAQVLGVVFATADQWLVVTVDGSDVQTAIVVVSAPTARLMFVIFPSGVHEVRPLAPEGEVIDVARALASSFAEDSTYAKPLTVRIRYLTSDAERDARFSIAARDTWSVKGSILQTSGSPNEIWSTVRDGLLV